MNKLFVISGPSGVGKDTIVKEFLKENPDFYINITYTTREPRKKEREGVNYYFVSREDFLMRAANGEFVEYDEHFGNLYGTSKLVLKQTLEKGNTIAVLDVNGALTIKDLFPDSTLIMITPKSKNQLKQHLIKRKSENEEEIQIRLARIEYELSKQHLFDYVIENNTIEESVKELTKICK